MGTVCFFHEAVFYGFAEFFQGGVFHGHKYLVGRRINRQLVSMRQKLFFDAPGARDSRDSDFQIKIILKQCVKLHPQDSAFCNQGSVLFYNGEEMGNQLNVRKLQG